MREHPASFDVREEVGRLVAEHLGLASPIAPEATRLERVASLWGGYGELLRARFPVAGEATTAIVKWIHPPRGPRREDARGHARKERSYDVELAWYRRYAARCGARCRVATAWGALTRGSDRLLVLEDLDVAGFGERRSGSRARDLDACLGWLAALHATFLGVAPDGLWRTGTYWHLATRPDELAATRDVAVRDAAPVLDARLEGARFRTLVHGDAKAENFCFGSGGAVAAVDFQYVGGGVGVRDVAYLLYGAADARDVGPRLDRYFAELARHLAERGIDARPIEAEWRELYPVACADFVRFLAGWSPGAYARDRAGQALLREVAEDLARAAQRRTNT